VAGTPGDGIGGIDVGDGVRSSATDAELRERLADAGSTPASRSNGFQLRAVAFLVAVLLVGAAAVNHRRGAK